MKWNRDTRRRITNVVMAGLCLACLGAALVPLLSIIYTALVNGIPAFQSGFFTLAIPPACNPQTEVCHPGGIGPAIIGTIMMLGLGAAIAIPTGILAGIFLSEWGHLRLVQGMRFLIEVMTGLPSIIVGIFIYTLFLAAANAGYIPREFVLSGFAGAVALAVIMLPIVTRTTEDALRYVPVNLREAGLALGIRRWRVTTSVVVSTGRTSLITGVLLAVARAGGETAPLIIVTQFTQFYATGYTGSIAAIPPLIYQFGLSGVPNWTTLAWGATLVIVGIVLIISVVARLAAGIVGTRGGLGGGG